jgi:hypothetical protein
LPDYESLRPLLHVARASFGTFARLWRHVKEVDLVWVWGSGPFSIVFAIFVVLTREARRLDAYARTRSSMTGRASRGSRASRPRRRLERRRATPPLLTQASHGRGRNKRRRQVHERQISGAADRHLAGAGAGCRASPRAGDWAGEISLFTVGLLEHEKSPRLLLPVYRRAKRRSVSTCPLPGAPPRPPSGQDAQARERGRARRAFPRRCKPCESAARVVNATSGTRMRALCPSLRHYGFIS